MAIHSAQFSPQPGTDHGPFPLHRSFGHSHHLGNFRDAQAAKEPKFDHLGLARIELREPGQGIFKRQQVYVPTGLDDQVVKCDAMPRAAPLGCPMSPSMIDEDLSHRASGNGQEMGSSLPINAWLTDELQVGFVNQRGRLKSMVATNP